MKILHLVAGELSGGAARGALWLHQGLKQQGVESSILTTSKDNFNDPSIKTINNTDKRKFFSLIRSKLDSLLLVFYKKRNKNIFSTGFFGYNFTKTKEYVEADIIHLHWVNAGFVRTKDLKKVKKPIVWTVRDMWPLTGGCHYSLKCEKYKTGCGACPQLKSTKDSDLSRKVVKNKIKYLPKNIKVIGISNWVVEICKQSKVFKSFDIRHIPNNINTSNFFSIEKELARKILGIETSKKVILIGSNSVADFYKGFNKFFKSLNNLDEKKYYICLFGRNSENVLNNTGFEFKSLGYLADEISLRLAYSSADVFVAPSIMEAFGKTLVESMACGTPVVCFDATGPKDIVDHKINGYKAIPFEAEDLARGIEWVSFNDNWNLISERAKDKAVGSYDSSIIAAKYKELYTEVFSLK